MPLGPTSKEIKEALDEAYNKAGQNAYFGNGFEAGVRFAKKKFKARIEELNDDNAALSKAYNEALLKLGKYEAKEIVVPPYR